MYQVKERIALTFVTHAKYVSVQVGMKSIVFLLHFID